MRIGNGPGAGLAVAGTVPLHHSRAIILVRARRTSVMSRSSNDLVCLNLRLSMLGLFRGSFPP
jgi:hypothetical protein